MMDWDERYRNQDTPWCKGRGHPMLDALVRQSLPPDFSGRILVPGCGRGWDIAAITAILPEAEVVGIDLSRHALAEVASDIRENPAVRLIQGDFLDATWLGRAIGAADAIWEHTCFCAIDPSRRGDYVASAATILKPGGILAGMFFLDLDDEGGRPPWNCPLEELNGHFGAAFDTHHCDLAHETFKGRHGEEYAVIMHRRP